MEAYIEVSLMATAGLLVGWLVDAKPWRRWFKRPVCVWYREGQVSEIDTRVSYRTSCGCRIHVGEPFWIRRGTGSVKCLCGGEVTTGWEW